MQAVKTDEEIKDYDGDEDDAGEDHDEGDAGDGGMHIRAYG